MQRKLPPALLNPISLLGGTIAVFSLVIILALLVLGVTEAIANPYTGILTFLLGPAALVLGLILIPIGASSCASLQRRRGPPEVSILHDLGSDAGGSHTMTLLGSRPSCGRLDIGDFPEDTLVQVLSVASRQRFALDQPKGSSPVGLPFRPQEESGVHSLDAKPVRQLKGMGHEEDLDACLQQRPDYRARDL